MLPGGSGRCSDYNWGVGNPHECLKLIEISRKRQEWYKVGLIWGPKMIKSGSKMTKNVENGPKNVKTDLKLSKKLKKAQNRSKK